MASPSTSTGIWVNSPPSWSDGILAICTSSSSGCTESPPTGSSPSTRSPEAYHIPNLHKDSVGLLAAGGLTVCARFGKHHRQTVAMKHLKEIADLPSEQSAPFTAGAIAFVSLIFPNSVLLFFGDHAEFFQVFPGDTVDAPVTLQSMFDY